MLPGFPLGTLLVNAAASFVVGVLLGLASVNGALPERPRLLINVGILGGLSTCSAFSAETFAMLADGRFPAAFVNIALNVGLSLALVAAGWWIAVSTAAALSR
jgi:CrcB protein